MMNEWKTATECYTLREARGLIEDLLIGNDDKVIVANTKICCASGENDQFYFYIMYLREIEDILFERMELQ